MALEFITQAPRSQKLILGIFFLLIVLVGGYFFMLQPKMIQVDTLRGELDKLEAELSQNRALAANLSRFRAEAAQLRARLASAQEKLPNEKEMPGLYRQLTNLAHQSGLTVVLFQPKEVKQEDVYAEVPITLSAETGYHQLGTFFERMSRLPRLVSMKEMKLQGNEKGSGSIRADVTLATYLFRPEGAPLPEPSKGAQPGGR
ncbi:MAG TPA: type 4a pilus biogenesis protein PilO [Methylomirabilota bacterium]|nr:type 4a pilus biogenesis protein PilO [Methylomirabilota bacterium]